MGHHRRAASQLEQLSTEAEHAVETSDQSIFGLHIVALRRGTLGHLGLGQLG